MDQKQMPRATPEQPNHHITKKVTIPCLTNCFVGIRRMNIVVGDERTRPRIPKIVVAILSLFPGVL